MAAGVRAAASVSPEIRRPSVGVATPIIYSTPHVASGKLWEPAKEHEVKRAWVCAYVTHPVDTSHVRNIKSESGLSVSNLRSK